MRRPRPRGRQTLLPEPAMIAPRWFLPAAFASLILGPSGLSLGASPATAPVRVTYEQQVRPILKAHCFACHGEEEKPKANLDLRLARLMVRGGKSGPAIVAGRHEESLLWERIDADEMP